MVLHGDARDVPRFLQRVQVQLGPQFAVGLGVGRRLDGVDQLHLPLCRRAVLRRDVIPERVAVPHQRRAWIVVEVHRAHQADLRRPGVDEGEPGEAGIGIRAERGGVVGGRLHQVQLGVDADFPQVAGEQLDVLGHRVHCQDGSVEAIRIAGLGQQRARLVRVILVQLSQVIATHRLQVLIADVVVAVQRLCRVATGVGEPVVERVHHLLLVDRQHRRVAHALVRPRRARNVQIHVVAAQQRALRDVS